MTTNVAMAQPMSQQTWGLCIGISEYVPKSLSLKWADKDAIEFSSTFLKYGLKIPEDHYRILKNSDATRDKILTQLGWLNMKARPEDRVYIFYAGHGKPSSPFLPHDSTNLLSLEEIKTALQKIHAQDIIVIVDACYSGKLAGRGARGVEKEGLTGISRGLTLNMAKATSEVVIMTSANGIQQAVEFEGQKNGLFTHCLMNTLMNRRHEIDTNRDGEVTLYEVYQDVYRTVTEDSQQEPQLSSLEKAKEIVLFSNVALPPSQTSIQDITAIPPEKLVTPYAPFTMKAKKDVVALAFSNDGKLLLSGNKNKEIQCWDLERKESVLAVKLKKDIVFLDFLNETSIVSVDKSGNVFVIDLPTGKLEKVFSSKSDPRKVTIDAVKRNLAIATKKEYIEIFDLKARMRAGTIDARNKIKDIRFLGFDYLGTQLIGITKKAKAFSWNPSTQSLLREVAIQSSKVHGSKSAIHSASTNPGSNIFVVGLQEVALPKGGLQKQTGFGDLVRQNMIIAYDLTTGMETKRIKTIERIDEIALGPGSDYVMVINDDSNDIVVINLRNGDVVSSVTMEERPQVVAVAGNDSWLAAGAKKGLISVWALNFR